MSACCSFPSNTLDLYRSIAIASYTVYSCLCFFICFLEYNAASPNDKRLTAMSLSSSK